MTDIQHSVVAFIDQRELSVVRQALEAMHDVISLKREIGLPVLTETRQAILDLENQVLSLKEECLRSLSPEQPTLPGMEHLHQDATKQP